jgi:hypothetical protein
LSSTVAAFSGNVLLYLLDWPAMRIVQFLLVSACALSACAANAQEAEGCEQYSRESPYIGYAPTGWKGLPERDPVWFARVRPVPKNGTGYTMRAAPKGSPPVIYDSIEPTALGGRHYGFMARRERCSVLIDASGRALIPDRFGNIENISWEMQQRSTVDDSSTVTLKLVSDGPQGVSWTLLRFVKGVLVARAPHTYRNSYLFTRFMSDRHVQLEYPGSRLVNVSGKFGVLRSADLQEVIEPIFDGVVRFPTGLRGKDAWVVENNAELALRSFDGMPIPSAKFDDFKVVPESQAGPSYVILVNSRERKCHFYDVEFRLMIDADIPMGTNGCNGFDHYDGLLVINDVQGGMRGFRLEHDGRVSLVFNGSEGKYVARARNGIFIVEGKVGDAIRYRLTTGAGKPLSGYDFDAFEDIGCSFIRVKKDNVWYFPAVDGSLNPRGFMPVSC